MRFLLALIFFPGIALASPAVLTDIPPVHSLVSMVMRGVGEPDLLIERGSPHDHVLLPSDADRIAGATVIFWVGPELTPWLGQAAQNLNPDLVSVELLQANDVVRVIHEEGDHRYIDPHAWLMPQNARVWLQEISRRLSQLDPANSAEYERNAAEALALLDGLQVELASAALSVSSAGLLVEHDSLSYFRQAFDLPEMLAVMDHDGVAPGARRLADLRKQLAEGDIRCLIQETDAAGRYFDLLDANGKIGRMRFDPLGGSLPRGADMYSQLLQGLMNGATTCVESFDGQ